MIEAVSLNFSDQRKARAAILAAIDSPADIPKALKISPPQPVLVVIGGADKLSDAIVAQLRQIFEEGIAPLAERLNLLIIDGGTDAGIMRLMGRARQKVEGKFPLVGIVPASKVQLPPYHPSLAGAQDTKEGHKLEENHTHFVLVPGQAWGAESPWLARCADLFSGKAPSIVVLINGGSISLIDLKENLSLGHPAVVIAGSGRLADTIAESIRRPKPGQNPEIEALLHSDQNSLLIHDLSEPIETFVSLLQQLVAYP